MLNAAQKAVGLKVKKTYLNAGTHGFTITPRFAGTPRFARTPRFAGTPRSAGAAWVGGKAWVGGDATAYGNAEFDGDAEVDGDADYIVFKNWWSSGRYFTWTRSNNKWKVGCFYGSGEELIAKAYKDSEKSGREYERVVNYVESILEEENNNNK